MKEENNKITVEEIDFSLIIPTCVLGAVKDTLDKTIPLFGKKCKEALALLDSIDTEGKERIRVKTNDTEINGFLQIAYASAVEVMCERQ